MYSEKHGQPSVFNPWIFKQCVDILALSEYILGITVILYTSRCRSSANN